MKNVSPEVPSLSLYESGLKSPFIRAEILTLAQEHRATLTTAEAAFHLNRKPQTLRLWACHEDGPLRPLRIHGRLAWKTEDIRALVIGEQPTQSHPSHQPEVGNGQRGAA